MPNLTTFFLSAQAPPADAPGAGVTHSRALPTRNAYVQVPATAPGSLVPSKLALVAGANTVNFNGGGPSTVGFLGSFASPPLAAQTIPPGRWTMAFAATKGAAFSAHLFAVLYLWDPVTGTVRHMLRDAAEAMSGGISVSPLVGQTMEIPAFGGTAAAGDYLVLEVWAYYRQGSNPFNQGVELRYGYPHEDVFTLTYAGQPGSYLIAPVELRFAGENVFAFDVDWTEPLVTTESYATRVLAARSGAEQRIALRTVRDETMKFRCLAIDGAEAALLARLTETGRARYRVPWWPDGTALDAPLAAGSLTIPVATATRAYAVGGDLILWQRPGTWEVATIASLTAADVTLTAPTGAAWGAGTLVLPLRPGWLVANVTRAWPSAAVASADVTVLLETVPVVG